MSFSEQPVLDIGHEISLTCDRPHCFNSVTVMRNTRDQCNRMLVDLGWRLYRGKQLCPVHAEKIAKRLRK